MTPAAKPLLESLKKLHLDKPVHSQDDMFMVMIKFVLSANNHGSGCMSYMNKHAINSYPTTQPGAKAGFQPYDKAGSFPPVHNTAARVLSEGKCAAHMQRGHDTPGYHG